VRERRYVTYYAALHDYTLQSGKRRPASRVLDESSVQRGDTIQYMRVDCIEHTMEFISYDGVIPPTEENEAFLSSRRASSRNWLRRIQRQVRERLSLQKLSCDTLMDSSVLFSFYEVYPIRSRTFGAIAARANEYPWCLSVRAAAIFSKLNTKLRLRGGESSKAGISLAIIQTRTFLLSILLFLRSTILNASR